MWTFSLSHRGVLLGLLASLIWSGHSTVSSLGISVGLQPMDFAALRVLGAGGLLLPYLWKRRTLVQRLGLARCVLLILCAGVPYSLFLTQALNYAPVSHNGVVCMGMVPLLALLIKWLWFKETPGRRSVQGMLILLAGLGLFALSVLTGTLGEVWKGDLLFLLCACLWALFGILTARWQVPALTATAICGVGSLPYLVPYVWWLEPARLAEVSASQWLLQLLYQGPIVAGVAIYAYSRCAASMGAERAALFSAIVPAGTAVVGLLVLAQPVAGLQWLGIGLLTLGIIWTLTGPPGIRRATAG